MKGVIIILTELYMDRAHLLKAYYASKGYDMTIITSDYSHLSKCKKVVPGTLQIPVIPYEKNLSIKRLHSHYQFAKDIKKELEQMRPDLIHTVIPANSFAKEMVLYKREHPEVKLIIDVNDLWPEAMPISKVAWMLPFKIWKNIRDKYIEEADQIYAECNLFRQILLKYHNVPIETLYWASELNPIHKPLHLKENEMHFCYLGSINHIIDIDCIVKLLAACQKIKPTYLHLIGKGEAKEQLIAAVRKQNVKVIDYGAVFDQVEKQRVFSHCNYSLNMMKESVMVGLTTKSLDYLRGQVPMINTIDGDTHDLCETYNIGWNINDSNIDAIASAICKESIDIQLKRREACEKVYLKYFTKESFFQTLAKTSIVNNT